MKPNTQMFTRLFALIMFAILYVQTLFSQALTVGEVHSYQVGDEFAIRTSFETGLDEFRIEKILKRTDFGTDSVQFVKEIILHQFNYQDLFWGKTKNEERYTIFKLNDAYFKNFKQQDTIWELYGDSGRQLLMRHRMLDVEYFDSCQTLVNERIDNSWSILSGEYNRIYKAYKGLGVLYYYHEHESGTEDLLDQSFIYYKKNGISCGDTGFQFMSLEKLSLVKQFKIWPNPAKDLFHVNCEQAFEIKMYDASGQLIMNKDMQPGSGIDIREFSVGFYFIEVHSENGFYQTKLLVQ